MKIHELDTPSLIVRKNILLDNIHFMQDYANRNKVALRPHTKTHKTSHLALLQQENGAKGITVAKVGEAEIMAAAGVKDIFIANEIVGEIKLQRIKNLQETINVSFGLDSIPQARMIEKVFTNKKANVLIEIEVGENRSGIIEDMDFIRLLDYIKSSDSIHFKGIFSHDGHSYSASNLDDLRKIHDESQKRTLHFATLAMEAGLNLEVVSIGSTPSLIQDFPIMEGVTEIRPGTYIFMDASQANVVGDFHMNATTVLATIISKPTDERVVLDVGAKGLTMQKRSKGITATEGLGKIVGFDDVVINSMYDEHALIYNKDFSKQVQIGDKVEIIPNHICPVVNLYDSLYLVSGEDVLEEIQIDCRGKLK
ncbi:alanine racemase [Gudongella sp. DL1XJH-153]|uniref:alanine racemase n=1 Tax=Gudongella sp. DL1XJH-153 TaxID=3409804 RepID=UPI003BB75ADD